MSDKKLKKILEKEYGRKITDEECDECERNLRGLADLAVDLYLKQKDKKGV